MKREGQRGTPGYEPRPHLRFLVVCGLIGLLVAGTGFFVGCATDLVVPLPPKLPSLPSRPSRPSLPNLPSGLPNLPSLPSLPGPP